MVNDLKVIKNNYGEKMAHLCRELFPSLLEHPGLLSKLLLSKFAPNHLLYEHIVKCSFEDDFKNYIFAFVDVEKPIIAVNKSVRELLSDAGYDFYECHTEADIDKFRKYYAEDEEICTFKGGRLKRCDVFWAVKKNVSEIRRENFKNPRREDEYGTSVISIQFYKNGNNVSIKNRYNHSVNNPDATFFNNLDNIIPGLKSAFARDYGYNFDNITADFPIPDTFNYIIANDRRYYYFNYEINNVYYCPDNVIIDNGDVIQYDKSRYIVMDYFILDMQEKKIKLYADYLFDGFISGLDNINKIDVLNNKEDNTKRVILSFDNMKDVIIILNDTNNIIGYQNENLENIDNNFLRFNKFLRYLNIPNALKIGGRFLYDNDSLTELELSKVVEIRDGFLKNNMSVKKFSALNLKYVGDDFFYCNVLLEELLTPNLFSTGNNFMHNNLSLKVFNFSNLYFIGDNFLKYNIYYNKSDKDIIR